MGMAGARVGILMLLLALLSSRSVAGLGVNWGTLANNPLPPSAVVKMLQANNITKVKLFQADYDTVISLAGSDIEVMVAAPNDLLSELASSLEAAQLWVQQNVTAFRLTNSTHTSGVNIKWVAVGNEPFLSSYNGSYINSTLPALSNMVTALADAGYANVVKAIIPFNADILEYAPLPSATSIKVEYLDQILPMLEIFNSTDAPFFVNIYPFFNKYQNPDFPLDFAFFSGTTSPLVDGPHTYTNAVDASLDALISALGAVGFPNMPVTLGEIGWPSDGNQFATPALAGTFNQQLITHLQSNVGTPLRPNTFFEFYLFELMDENLKSISPGPFERHWGIFYYNGVAKYPLDLAGGTNGPPRLLKSAISPPYMSAHYCVLNEMADMTNLSQNINYACTWSDCTSLEPNSSCAGLPVQQIASYAFNTYYQFQNQDPSACYFQGLARTTIVDPSVGTCQFFIGLDKYTPTKSTTQFNYAPNSSGRSYTAFAAVTLFTLLLNTLFHLVWA